VVITLSPTRVVIYLSSDSSLLSRPLLSPSDPTNIHNLSIAELLYRKILVVDLVLI
jgi:hypothetical protein